MPIESGSNEVEEGASNICFITSGSERRRKTAKASDEVAQRRTRRGVEMVTECRPGPKSAGNGGRSAIKLMKDMLGA